MLSYLKVLQLFIMVSFMNYRQNLLLAYLKMVCDIPRRSAPTGYPLSPVFYLWYLGRFLLAAYENFMTVVRNLIQKKWLRMTQVLGREVVYARMSGMFYVTWGMSPRIGRTLGVFRERVARNR